MLILSKCLIHRNNNSQESQQILPIGEVWFLKLFTQIDTKWVITKVTELIKLEH